MEIDAKASFTITPGPAKPNVPVWLTGQQCPRIEYNPTSEYKFKKGDKTGWGVICQYTSRSQKEMNAIYVGGLEDRRADGYGEWHSEDEKISYHGGWKDNVANGYGKYCDAWAVDWPDSWARYLPGESETEARHTYEGGFKDGMFHGYGVLSFRDKSKYEGTWKEGRRWGYGKYIKDDGTVIEFQIEGAVKPAKKDDKKDDKKKDENKDKKDENPPQVIVVQPQQPQYVQPVVLPGQPVLQVPQPQPQGHDHQANVTISWGHGHGSPPQTTATPQPQPTYIYQPVTVNEQPVAIPVRPTTPTPIPVQFTYGSPPRPVTPQPPRQGSLVYAVPLTPQPQPTPGSPPYPDIQPLNLGGSPGNTQYFPHM